MVLYIHVTFQVTFISNVVIRSAQVEAVTVAVCNCAFSQPHASEFVPVVTSYCSCSLTIVISRLFITAGQRNIVLTSLHHTPLARRKSHKEKNNISADEFIMSSSSTTSPEEPPRQEAGPLPSKRGEIGYQEELHGQVEEENTTRTDEGLSPSLPARHPADRDGPPIISSEPPTVPPTDDASSTNTSSVHSKKSLISFFKPKLPVYGGVRLVTLMVFTLQLMLVGGTVAAWILVTQFMNKKFGGVQGNPMASPTIFVHIVFIIAVFGELVFLERRIFRLRAERYCHLHPGEMLPSYIRRTSSTSITRGLGMGFAPWNRPPLPTYAAALAQNGYGTGDVEDQLIGAPPPPAYGNTRGSTLLLSGFLRDSLRAQRPQSQGSEMSQHAGGQVSQPGERPISYGSRDEGWEEVRNAERSRRLEETLAALERPSTRQ